MTCIIGMGDDDLLKLAADLVKAGAHDSVVEAVQDIQRAIAALQAPAAQSAG